MPASRAPSDASTQGALGLVSPGATEDAEARSVIARQAPPNVAEKATKRAAFSADERRCAPAASRLAHRGSRGRRPAASELRSHARSPVPLRILRPSAD